MKRYIVKTVSEATADNPNFEGEVHTWWYGKGETRLRFQVDNARSWHDEFDFLNKWNVEEYGYTRKCDAARSYIYKNPENTKFWTTQVEIVEYEI